MIPFLVKHKGSDGPASIGTRTSLATDTDSGVAPAVLVLSAGNGTSGHRHGRVSGGRSGSGDN